MTDLVITIKIRPNLIKLVTVFERYRVIHEHFYFSCKTIKRRLRPKFDRMKSPVFRNFTNKNICFFIGICSNMVNNLVKMKPRKKIRVSTTLKRENYSRGSSYFQVFVGLDYGLIAFLHWQTGVPPFVSFHSSRLFSVIEHPTLFSTKQFKFYHAN